ncbi:hypothetical protein [Pedobacter metabolipauper]|uniref:Uncharacterized protein n=1 Tax=Pedobacter metabolipauper TaxID=425513 RepID=A0A4R6T3R2_9SPHI|nr:hypothetical protein [Pedobacter metabolipauper]TDQ12180.1 hypothetical protein ATK78_1314 [Pedobacter metabolipauper]
MSQTYDILMLQIRRLELIEKIKHYNDNAIQIADEGCSYVCITDDWENQLSQINKLIIDHKLQYDIRRNTQVRRANVFIR